MNRAEALSLAALVREYAPWTDGLYVFPVNPACQKFGVGPHLVSVSSGFLRVALYSWQDWADVVQQLQPSLGPTGLPLIDQRLFDEWVIEQLTRTDLDEQEQLCGTGELEIFVHDPENHAARFLVPSRATMAPVVDSSDTSQKTPVPTIPEIMLTLAWVCPACCLPLSLTIRMRLEQEYRLFAGPRHQGQGTEKRCPCIVWVEVDYCEQKDVQLESLEARVWHVVRRHEALDEPVAE